MKTTVQGLLLAPLPKEVVELMAHYCAAERYAYKHLVKGERALDIEKAVARKLQLNSRYSKDAVAKTRALITAQDSLLSYGSKSGRRSSKELN